MEFRYRKEALVGGLMIAAALIFTFLMMALRGASFHKGNIIHVSFSDISGLKIGDPARTSGVSVGKVKKIVLVGPGNVDVAFDVGNGPPPRADASAKIMSSDLFGARFVDYSPGTATAPLPAGQVLRGIKPADMSELAATLADRTRTLLDTATAASIMVSRELRVTLTNAQALIATLNSGASGSSRQLIGLLEELRRSLQRVDVLVAQNGPVVGQTLRNVQSATVHADSLVSSLSRTSVTLDSLIARATNGKGPLPALLNDSTIVHQLMGTNTALRELIADFKEHPGRYIRFRIF